ncbi:prephenate dehydrogenase/arogenate dehydrogenase family protein [Pedobacter sp. HMF7647]|uniref:Prephenate dehydrogenase/arogenate dehydrogenase family protein n=1 Tax=Hufsiella arboris TaxID=2695275 RepID=A0A7K1Y919_9SPHI|nr:prephenate dehydrogenase [Hufsiella arboris]MXV50920.1 prephenate dehydrogenase/arogenate dehydrogenase family protein [Hufsiella arboris]
MKIGIIGLGDMGKLYAKTFARAGYQVYGCDLPEKLDLLTKELQQFDIKVLQSGVDVSRTCDFIIYSTEAEKIDAIVSAYGHATKYGAIVAGQTSVKHPEIAAFEKHLPADVNIVTCHSLHGPGFQTEGQSLIVIRHRASDEVYQTALKVYEALGSIISEIPDFHKHDQIMADTQALTHMGFESMGTAWKNAGFFPWENASYNTGGIDNVKILITLRIFAYKSHVYAGLAILNPYARNQVKQYALSESELFKMMIQEKEAEFRERIYKARDFVFHESRELLMLDEDVLKPKGLSAEVKRKPNSHLSILAMVDAWYHLGVNPYENLIGQTPPFRLRLGIAEYLFKNDELLEESIQAALYDKTIRGDDLEFHSAVREWASIIGYGDLQGYKAHFEETKAFFSDRLEDGLKQSAELIGRLS